MRSTAVAALAGVAMALSVAAPKAEAVKPRRPNVIIILADDLGYGDTGVYGSPIVKTPNIDALAGDGVRFTDGYVTHPVCAPSRAAIMTGRYQTRFGWEFNPVTRDHTGGVSLGETLLPQVMKTAGYHTGMVGKWHLGQAKGHLPQDRGFDDFFGILDGGTAYMTRSGPGDDSYTAPGSESSFGLARSPLPPTATDDDKMTYLRKIAPVWRGREMVEAKGYLTEDLTEEAVKFIGDNKARPFFLYLAYNAPHTPLQATKTYLDRYPNVQDRGKRVYAAMVSALDDGIGTVRAKLKAEGSDRDTLIIFLSDNGCASYVLGACSNAPLNGFKGMHLEGGVRIPYIVAWPGHIPGGRVDHRMVSSLDIAPTAAALAGGSLPRGSDGVNLIPYLNGRNAGTPNPTLYWRAGTNFAIRDGRWKLWTVNKADPSELSEKTVGITPDGTPAAISPLGQHDMLYDLTGDIGEACNLAPSQARVVARLKAKIAAWDKGNVAPQWTSMRQSVFRFDGQVLKVFD
jgi:arylsulfatase A-like enzyme